MSQRLSMELAFSVLRRTTQFTYSGEAGGRDDRFGVLAYEGVGAFRLAALAVMASLFLVNRIKVTLPF
jgi:hypothetical protein